MHEETEGSGRIVERGEEFFFFKYIFNASVVGLFLSLSRFLLFPAISLMLSGGKGLQRERKGI